MKKSLLIIGLALSVSALAQDRRIHSGSGAATAPNAHTVYPEIYQAPSLPAVKRNYSSARQVHGQNNTTAFQVYLGTSGNCLGPAFGPKTNLWYDKDINTVAFTHRSSTPQNGFYMYDASSNGGVNWTNDHYTGGDSANIIRGRYPHGVIYNPQGNLDPGNAYVTTMGATNDGGSSGFCSTSWNGVMSGNAPIGGSTYHWTWYDCNSLGLNTLIPSGGQIVKNTGIVYWVVSGYDGTDYNDSITLIKGTWNTTTFSMDYTFNKMYVPMCSEDGTKKYVDVNTAWSDDGNIGYITLIGNDWACGDEPIDSTFGLIVFKTDDGGATWNKLGRPWLSLLDPWLANGNFFCTTAFEHDVVVDKNDNLHIAVAIGAYAGGGAISTGPGFWALFDINTPDQGASWQASVVGRPMTFRGTYGDANNPNVDPPISEDSRPQCSRSWDGSKIFFSWFDSDTIIFGSASGNIFPDMFCIGYDVDNGMWTTPMNMTQGSGTDLDGACHFGNISYYTINNGTDECVPLVGGMMANAPTSTGSVLQFIYAGDLCISNYNDTNIVISLNEWLGTPHHAKIPALAVSSNYPNPYSGMTSVDVTLPKAEEVTIEVTNAIGQVLSAQTYRNLHPGVNTLTIDGSSLSKGLYFFSVKAGNEVVTRTMSVK